MRTKHGVQIMLSAFIVVSYSVINSTQEPLKNPTQCGDSTEIAHMVEVCAKPMLNILEGTVERWPKTEKDVEDSCNEFGDVERCIKDVGRRCTKGLQRTIISTVSGSVQRVRKRECTKAKYPLLLKTYEAIEKVQAGTRVIMANSTIKLSVINSQMKDPDQKTKAVCCMINDMEAQIKNNMIKFPNESKVVNSIYRAVLEDVLDLICRVPKCNDPLRGYKLPKTRPEAGIIDLVLNIMFSLDAES